MSLEIKKEIIDRTIRVSDLPLGKLAITTQWGVLSNYLGLIVQRVALADGEHILVAIGERDLYWGNLDKLTDTCRVRVLESGTELIVNQ